VTPNCIIAPSPVSPWERLPEIIGLSRKQQGTVFRKHILNYGPLIHPATGEKIQIDNDLVTKLKDNFNRKICDIVQVPLANDKNEHVESPKENLGEVIGIEDDPKSGKIYALVDARRDVERFGTTYLGSSAFLHLDYPDSNTGETVGPTLVHVAVTNRPYVTGLDPYEPVVAATSESFGDPVLMEWEDVTERSTKEDRVPRTKDEILAELSSEHNIDVAALQTELKTAQERATTAEKAVEEMPGESDQELAEKIAATLRDSGSEISLSKGENGVSQSDLVNAVADLVQQNVSLSNSHDAAATRIAALEKVNTEREIDDLIRAGRVLPSKKEVFLQMALSHRELFDAAVPDEPIVAIEAEKGAAPQGETHQQQHIDVEAEITRLTNLMEGSHG
jgi:Mu-like prophage I protein